MKDESFNAFFDHLDSLGIRPRTVTGILKNLTEARRVDTLVELYSLLPGPQYPQRPQHTPFSFLASSTLSGHSHKGLVAVDSLARFAVLYADTVFIREPSLADRTLLNDASGLNLSLLSEPESLARELQTLMYLEPLFRAGLLKLARNTFPIPQNADGEKANKELKSIWNSTKQALYDRFARDTSFQVTYIANAKLCMSVAEGPLDLISNPSTIPEKGSVGHFGEGEFPELSNLPSEQDGVYSGRVNADHVAFSRLFDQLVNPILDDLGYAAVCSSLYQLNYLTDRTADVYALPQTKTVSNANYLSLHNALTHEVPVVFGTPLAQLVKLRNEESEAFKVYRDAITTALHQISSIGPAEVGALFADVVQPELNNIDLAMKRNRTQLLQSSGRDLLYTTGALSIVLSLGIVSPKLTPLLTAVGGAKAIADALKNLHAAFLDAKEAQANPYFFLWKARRAVVP